MGVLQAAAAWIRQYIGIKKGSRGTRRQRGQRERGRTRAGVDIIAAWWRAIRGSLAVDLGY